MEPNVYAHLTAHLSSYKTTSADQWTQAAIDSTAAISTTWSHLRWAQRLDYWRYEVEWGRLKDGRERQFSYGVRLLSNLRARPVWVVAVLSEDVPVSSGGVHDPEAVAAREGTL